MKAATSARAIRLATAINRLPARIRLGQLFSQVFSMHTGDVHYMADDQLLKAVEATVDAFESMEEQIREWKPAREKARKKSR